MIEITGIRGLETYAVVDVTVFYHHSVLVLKSNHSRRLRRDRSTHVAPVNRNGPAN